MKKDRKDGRKERRKEDFNEGIGCTSVLFFLASATVFVPFLYVLPSMFLKLPIRLPSRSAIVHSSLKFHIKYTKSLVIIVP